MAKEIKKLVKSVTDLESVLDSENVSEDDDTTLTDPEPLTSDNFDPKKRSEELTKRIKAEKDLLEEQNSTSNVESVSLDTQVDQIKLEKLSEEYKAVEKFPELKRTTDIYGNEIDPSKMVDQGAHEKKIVSANIGINHDTGKGIYDADSVYKKPEDMPTNDSRNDPKSKHFFTCITSACVVKDNCLRYRLRSSRDTSLPFFPEECSKNGNYISRADHPKITSLDPIEARGVFLGINV